MRHKRLVWPIIIMIMIMSITGCSKRNTGMGGLSNTKASNKVGEDEAPILAEGDDYPLTIQDYLKEKTILDKKPEKVAVLSGTPLNIWYDLGGKSICTSDISDNVKLIPEYEEEIKNLPAIGPVYNVDMEAIISHQPDLVIAQIGTQTNAAKKLKDMGFKVITTHIRGYDDVVATYRAFGKILQEEKKAEEKINKLEEQKEEIVSKLPKENKSVVILYVTSKTLSVKLDNSIAGDVANILNLENIASDLPPDTIGSESTPLDVEYIVEKNPDYILVTSMISSNEAAIKTMEEEFEKNPIWEGVDAVSEGRVVYLPQEYFLFNAGPYYAEAIEYMARGVYPEIYGKVTDWYER